METDKPVAWRCLDISRLRVGHCADKVLRWNKPDAPHFIDVVPLFEETAWRPLTDEEILQFWHGDHGLPGGRCVNVIELARFVEAKLKEKNA